MKAARVIKDNGFKDKCHFSRVTGIGGNYVQRMHTTHPAEFSEIVAAYAPYAHLVQSRAGDMVTVKDNDIGVSVTCERWELVGILGKHNMPRSVIMAVLLALAEGDPDEEATGELDELDSIGLRCGLRYD